jgi:hypothetical protein
MGNGDEQQETNILSLPRCRTGVARRHALTFPLL